MFFSHISISCLDYVPCQRLFDGKCYVFLCYCIRRICEWLTLKPQFCNPREHDLNPACVKVCWIRLEKDCGFSWPWRGLGIRSWLKTHAWNHCLCIKPWPLRSLSWIRCRVPKHKHRKVESCFCCYGWLLCLKNLLYIRDRRNKTLTVNYSSLNYADVEHNLAGMTLHCLHFSVSNHLFINTLSRRRDWGQGVGWFPPDIHVGDGRLWPVKPFFPNHNQHISQTSSKCFGCLTPTKQQPQFICQNHNLLLTLTRP